MPRTVHPRMDSTWRMPSSPDSPRSSCQTAYLAPSIRSGSKTSLGLLIVTRKLLLIDLCVVYLVWGDSRPYQYRVRLPISKIFSENIPDWEFSLNGIKKFVYIVAVRRCSLNSVVSVFIMAYKRSRSSSFYDAASSKRARFSGAVRGVAPASRIGRALRRSAASIRAMVVPGYTRASGYYGRFSRSSSDDGELKFFDTALAWDYDTQGEVPATGQLSLIPQGDTQSTRIGRKCTIKSIQIRGYNYFVPTTTATASALVNMYLVLDTQCNGAAADATDVFAGSYQITTAMLNLANSSRFRILKRWVVPFNSNAGASTAYNNVVKPLEFSMKCNIPLEFSGTTGALTEIRSNNIFLVAGAVLQDDKVSFAGTCRLRFVG